MNLESNSTCPLAANRSSLFFFSALDNLHRMNNSHLKYANGGQMMMACVRVHVCVCECVPPSWRAIVPVWIVNPWIFLWSAVTIVLSPVCEVTTHWLVDPPMTWLHSFFNICESPSCLFFILRSLLAISRGQEGIMSQRRPRMALKRFHAKPPSSCWDVSLKKLQMWTFRWQWITEIIRTNRPGHFPEDFLAILPIVVWIRDMCD